MRQQKTIEYIVKEGLCTGCGTCAAICPKDAIDMIIEPYKSVYFPQLNDNKCTKCGICVKYCSGKFIDFKSMNKEIFDKEPDDALVGNFQNCYFGYSSNKDIRYNSASGGFVTHLLIYLLKENIIQGALVTRMNNNKPLEPLPYIARTKEEIISASKSKYCPVPANIALKEIFSANKDDKFAIVGLPCHIHGMRKLMLNNTDLQKKIFLCIGLFCSHNNNFKMAEFVTRWNNIDIKDITKLDYRGEGWPGSMSIVLKDGTKKLIPYTDYGIVHSLNLFTPSRCFLCMDGLANFADISCADAWFAESISKPLGCSLVISRNKKSEQVIKGAISKKSLVLNEITNNDLWKPTSYRPMRVRGALYIRRIFRRPIPDYNAKDLPPNMTIRLLTISYIFGYIASFIALKKWTWKLLILLIPLLRPISKGLNKIGSKIIVNITKKYSARNQVS
jgi:coenzyme F420 hydrogenase subunit beta